jgi:hypothetical protein
MVVPAAQAVAAAQVPLEERVPQAALTRMAATGAPGAAVVQAVLAATVLRVRLGRRVATAAMLATAVLVALAVLPVWVPVRPQAVWQVSAAMAGMLGAPEMAGLVVQALQERMVLMALKLEAPAHLAGMQAPVAQAVSAAMAAMAALLQGLMP